MNQYFSIKSAWDIFIRKLNAANMISLVSMGCKNLFIFVGYFFILEREFIISIGCIKTSKR